MKTLEEVMASIEAFKKDMEDLGVQIHVGVRKTNPGEGPKMGALLCLVVREDMEGAEAVG